GPARRGPSAATSSSPRCSPTSPTTCRSPARRCSGRSWPSWGSPTSTTPCGGPTTPTTGSPPTSTPATCGWRTGSRASCRPATCTSTAPGAARPAPPSAAGSTAAWARRTRTRSSCPTRARRRSPSRCRPPTPTGADAMPNHAPYDKPVWGSDVMVDALRRLDLPYIALNPGSSYRGLHDSLVNYAGDEMQIIECPHEKIAVALAHGYAKASGRAMGVVLHDLVGLLQGTMGVYYAYADRTPVLVLGGSGPADHERRRPYIDWIHSANVQGEGVREYTKWDHEPRSIEAGPGGRRLGRRPPLARPRRARPGRPRAAQALHRLDPRGQRAGPGGARVHEVGPRAALDRGGARRARPRLPDRDHPARRPDLRRARRGPAGGPGRRAGAGGRGRRAGRGACPGRAGPGRAARAGPGAVRGEAPGDGAGLPGARPRVVRAPRRPRRAGRHRGDRHALAAQLPDPPPVVRERHRRDRRGRLRVVRRRQGHGEADPPHRPAGAAQRLPAGAGLPGALDRLRRQPHLVVEGGLRPATPGR